MPAINQLQARTYLKRILIFAPISFIASFIIVNLSDEPPTPLAASMITLPSPSIPSNEDNAWLVMLGLQAPENVSATAEGLSILENARTQANALAKNTDQTERTDAASEETEKDAQQPTENQINPFCSAETKCWNIKDPMLPNLIQKSLDQHRTLLARYRHLTQLPFFVPLAQPGYEELILPAYMLPVSQAARLARDEALLYALNNNYQEALSLLETDQAFWRQVLRYHRSLVDDMTAVGQIQQNAYWLSLRLADPQFDIAPYVDTLRTLLSPLTPDELNIGSSLQREFISQANFIQNVWFHPGAENSADALRHILIHPQAMVNRLAERMPAILELAACRPSDFVQKREIYQTDFEDYIRKHEITRISNFEWFYDYVGKIFQAEKTIDESFYVARTFDTAAYLQLVRTQLEIRLANLAAEDIPAFLSAHPELNDPYTDKPFEWDSQHHQLSFNVQDKKDDRSPHFESSVNLLQNTETH